MAVPKRKLKKMAGGLYSPTPKPRYGAGQLVDAGTRDRTISRFNRLKAQGIKVPGVSQKDLDTGLGARRVKQALADSRVTYHSGPPTPRAPGARKIDNGPLARKARKVTDMRTLKEQVLSKGYSGTRRRRRPRGPQRGNDNSTFRLY